MAFSNFNRRTFQRSMQSSIAGFGGWSSANVDKVANAAWKSRPPSNTNTYIEFRNLATQTIRLSRNAELMQVNPRALPTLSRDPTIERGQPMHAYRVAVHVVDASGHERQTTVVTVRSSRELTGEAVQAEAVRMAQSGQRTDSGDTNPTLARLRPQWSIETDIVSAGRRTLA